MCDVLVAGVFLYLSPELLPAWFLMFFVAFAAGYRWNLRYAATLCFGLLLLGFALDLSRGTPAPGTRDLAYSVSFFAASFLGTVGMAFLGDKNRQFAGQQDFLSRISNTMHVDLGLAESLRLLLEELCAEFQTAGRAAGLPGHGPGADFPVAIEIWRKRATGAGKSADHARGWISAGRHGSFVMLECRWKGAAAGLGGTGETGKS